MKKFLKLFASGVFLLLCAALTTLVACSILALTPWGLSLAVKVAQKTYPELVIERSRGSLFNATLEGVRYETPELTVKMGSANFSIANIALIDRIISISHVATEGLVVRADTTAMSSDKETASAVNEGEAAAQTNTPFVLPFAFELTSLTMTDTDICVDGSCAVVKAFETSVKGMRSYINITRTALDTLSITTPPSSEKKVPLAQTIQEVMTSPWIPNLPEIKLPVTVSLGQFSLRHLSVNQELLVDTLGMGLEVKDSEFKLNQLTAQTPTGDIQASARAQMTGAWPLHLDAAFSNVRLTDAKALRGVARVSGDLCRKLTVETTLTDPDPIETILHLEPTAEFPRFDLAVSGKIALSPAQDQTAPGTSVDISSLKASGSWTDWGLEFLTRLDTPAPYPSTIATGNIKGKELTADVLLSAQANQWAKSAFKAQMKLSDQGLSMTGDIEAASGKLDLIAKALRPDFYHPLLKGALKLRSNLALTTNADMNAYRAEVKNLKLTGRLDGNPLNVTLKASADETKRITIPEFSAVLSRNSIRGNALFVDNQLKANVSLQGTELFLFNPLLTGKIKGNLTTDGPLDALNVKAHFSSSRLKFAEHFSDTIRVNANIRASGTQSSTLTLSAKGLDTADMHFEGAYVSISGTQAKHNLGVKVNGDQLSADIHWSGVWDSIASHWDAVLNRAKINAGETRWSAIEKPKFSIHTQDPSISITQHCWRETGTQAKVCLTDALRLAQVGNAAFSFHAIPLDFAQRWAPAGVNFIGKVKGNLNAKWSAPDVKSVVVTSDWNADNAGLSALVNEKTVRVVLKETRLQIELDQNQALANLHVAVNPKHPLTANIVVQDPAGTAQFTGTVKSQDLALDEFSAIASALTPLTQMKGFLTTDLTLSGTPEAPRANGRVDLNKLQLYGPTIPLDMQPSDFHLVLTGDKSEFKGTLVSSEGPLMFEGNGSWTNIQAPTAFVHVHGKNFRIVAPPYVKALLSPDVRLTMDESRVALSGNIDIAQANISAETLPPSAIQVSDDEVIVDEYMQPIVKEASRPLAIDSSLVIRLGDDVRLRAFGLAAQMTGSVTVTQSNETLGLRGTLTMPEGHFQAYGQDLIVRKGSFIFAGPMTDPIVDLVAERNPDSTEDDVKVGIKVSGKASQMETEIYSDPAMDQAAQLSYLLRGRGLETNAEDNSMLSSALLTIGLSQTGQLISGIGDALAIRDLGVSTQGVGDNSQVVVSGYVLPDLQVKYAMNIFDSLSTLTLRYRLMPKLFVEASSGVNQTIDVLYNFEF